MAIFAVIGLGITGVTTASSLLDHGYNLDIRDDRTKPLVKWCERFSSGVSTEHAIPWAGLRPIMPDMTQKVGPGRNPGVFYKTGHGHLGWTLSAVTAEIIAEQIHGSMPSIAQH